jgi:hypothetical protein
LSMELGVGYPDSPMEAEDAAYPCKGCGEVYFHPAHFDEITLCLLFD